MGWNLGLNKGLALVGSVTYNSVGATTQFFTVPAGVTSLLVTMRGASSGNFNPGSPGGAGAVRWMRFNINVTPGEILSLKAGVSPVISMSITGAAGGWPDGGNGGPGSGYFNGSGFGGGGSSSIWRGATLLAIAGAGGGITKNLFVALTFTVPQSSNNGASGISGQASYVSAIPWALDLGGKGATQFAGGAGGPRLQQQNPIPVDPTISPAAGTVAGSNGTFMHGGNGGSGAAGTALMGGSGGGGGYYGGGGGSSRKQPVDSSGNNENAGGGGGSSWVDTTQGVTLVTYTYANITGGNGRINIEWNNPAGWSLMAF